jgi:hypothetical protein
MKTQINTAKIAAAIVLVLLTTSVMMTVAVQAQESPYEEGPHGGPLFPDVPYDYPGPNYEPLQPQISIPSGETVDRETDTQTFLSFRPNPIGLGQPVLINFWINPALASNHRFMKQCYLLHITKPDGSTVTYSFDSEPATTANWLELLVDQVGEWTFQLEFTGYYFPAGVYWNGYVINNMTVQMTGPTARMPYSSAYYRPSETGEQTLMVQEDQLVSWPPAALPTDYWDRPVSLNNREWYPITGAWPGDGYVGGGPVWDSMYPDTTYIDSAGRTNFNPWVPGPDSAHVVWRRQGEDAGLIGGPAYIYGELSPRGYPGSADLIYNGRCYETLKVQMNGEIVTCATCYDLRTGEIHYAIPTSEGGVTPNRVAYYPPGPDTLATAHISTELLAISGSTLRKVDAYTGAVSEYDISPISGGLYYYQYGGWVLSVQNIGNSSDPEYRLINWTTQGNSNNFESRLLSNVSWPWRNLPNQYSSAYGIVTCDFNEMLATFTSRDGYNPIIGELDILWGIDVYGYDMATQQMLPWEVHLPDQGTYSGSCVVSDHGKTAILDQKGVFECYDMRTGHHEWTSERMDYPFGATSFGAYSIASAYGMIFRSSYDGIYAFDWDTGKIVWHYIAPARAHFESPYQDNGVECYSFNSGCEIADGKMYVYNSEHTTTWPITRGWSLYCLDILTGDEIWKIMNPMDSIAIADGYMVVSNTWDGYTYCFGMGKTETTVTAPDMAVPSGTAMTISGKVLDMSPAQPGTPCVSKDSMETQMEYLHLQQPIDGIWHNETITGVPVTLTAIHEDGTVYDLGQVTSNGYYGSFGKSWTPTKQGLYEVIANFGPDDSYGSSAASTFVTVGPAPSQGQEPETEPTTTEPTTSEPPTSTTEEPTTTAEPTTTEEPPTGEAPFPTTEVIIVAAIAVAVVIGVGAYWVLRRQK